ncbi:MAG: carboxypeptidase-like regulatory domain-containing protein [Planctomycetota bacterium]
MPRPLLPALVLFAAAALGLWWLLADAPPAPPPSDAAPASAGADGTDANAAPITGVTDGSALPASARAAAGREDDPLAAPEFGAGVSGCKGRVVDHQKLPVGDCGVRVYRGALDSVLPQQLDLFAAAIDNPPQIVAGEVRTAADGTWQLTGVWPRAFYVLFAGIGTDAPMHQIVTQHPAPGEIVDLGDLVLPHAGVITGEVVGEDGEPLARALVRAVDQPGTLAALFPPQRIDPQGALLVREPAFPMNVVEMPPWAKDLFAKLPIPTAYTSPDGRFRLVGVTPGSNLLATTMAGYLSDVKPSVPVRPGQEKDVGRIKLRLGEELVGMVVDGKGKPIADAEVLAGSTLTIAPVDLASRIGRTDAEGRFRGTGFSPGRVTVAARRGKGQSWTLAEPQSVLGDVVVTLPTLYAVEVTVTLADGKPAPAARLQLLPGRPSEGAAEMFLLGVTQPIDLRERRKPAGPGKWRIENLTKGSYALVVDAPGHAVASARIDVADGDTSAAIALVAPYAFTVRVVGPKDEPIRNALVVAQPRGNTLVEMPMACGRTDKDGVRRIESMQADELRVSAEHPKWGVAHGKVEKNGTVTLRMVEPGSLRGVIRENGAPPTPGKFTLVLEQRGGERGPVESVPILLTPGLDGTFASKALQPGDWRLTAIPALDAMRTPGGIMAMAQTAFLTRDTARATAQVRSGEVAEVALEAGQKPIDGPTATLTGSLTVDGQLGAGYALTAYAKDRMFSARVDERGRFDFGQLPAGALSLSVLPRAEDAAFGPMETLWSGAMTLQQGEARDEAIEVLTSSLRGVCVDAAGNPVAGVMVRAEGRFADRAGARNVPTAGRRTNATTTTNAQGEFTFARIAAGTWQLSVRTNRGEGRGEVKGIEVAGGVPAVGVRLVVQPTIQVKGRVDLARLGQGDRRWAWAQARREGGAAVDGESISSGFGVDAKTGEFRTNELSTGRYVLTLYVGNENGNDEYDLGELVVTPAGATDVVLTPGAKKVMPPR